jgi:uncharacterized protein
MIDAIGEGWSLLLVGLAGGILLGLAARLGRFCTMGAIEDMLYGGSSLRMRMWVLAIGLSVLGVHGMQLAGLFDPAASFYLSTRWVPLASILGGFAFGYGMALAGNCGYGAIARLGGGDLRAFVIVLVMGISAFLCLSGPFAHLRVLIFPQEALLPGDMPPGIAAWAGGLTGLPPALPGLAIGLAITLAALASREMLARPGAIVWGGVVALAVLSAWAGTQYIADHGFAAAQVTSHSFAAPVGETLLYAMLGSSGAPGFGVGSVAGVILGAFAGSLIKGHFRWEACEDPRELRRQIAGAALMGAGAVVAAGCTIGQGVSAFSVLAFSAPVTFAAVLAGAALGLRQLIAGFSTVE